MMCRCYTFQGVRYIRVCVKVQLGNFAYDGQHIAVPLDWVQIGHLNWHEFWHLKDTDYGQVVKRSVSAVKQAQAKHDAATA